MSAYLEKQKLLDWLNVYIYRLDGRNRDTASIAAATLYDVVDQINSGVFDWQPND